MKNELSETYKKIKNIGTKIINNKDLRETADFLTDTSTFKKTLWLSLFYVFLFYLPFTFNFLFLNKVVFFQGDYLYQFSTIIMDFRDRLFHLNFSTWDFKNGIGYDYFANFYYIPLDITLLPFFIFPFLAASKLMWLSFLFKILLGTVTMSYLLKLYKMSNKTILLVSVLYGTADLFFSQNVFASYTGLIFYIPLVLIAIELIFQRKNFFVFALVFFQIFLFNSYWAWGLSVFMAITLFIRTIFEFFTFENIGKIQTYFKSLVYLFLSMISYLIGLGMSAVIFYPTFKIMQNEPRMEISQINASIPKIFIQIFSEIFNHLHDNFGHMVYFKEFFKMLVPNLYMYSGFFYDEKASYWPMTNQIIIYSSILASFSLFFLVVYPTFMAKKKLTKEQVKVFVTLKIVTIFATVLMVLPLTAYLFSLNSGEYLRWLIFYGVLLIIDFAFILEYKLINKNLFAVYIVASIAYLIFSIQYNRHYIDVYMKNHSGNRPNIFTAIDENVAYTMIIVYIIILFMIIIFDKYLRYEFVLIAEKIAGIGFIFAICTSADFSKSVDMIDLYGNAINRMIKEVDTSGYRTDIEVLFNNSGYGPENLPDMAYLFDFPVYDNFNVYHSLPNPTFTFSLPSSGHARYFHEMDIPYLYYYYYDPSIFIISDFDNNEAKNGMYDPSSELVDTTSLGAPYNSSVSIYQKTPQFSIGNGYTTYYTIDEIYNFDYLWLDSLYIQNNSGNNNANDALISLFNDNGFQEENISRAPLIHQVSYTYNDITNFSFTNDATVYHEIPVNVSKDDANVIIFSSTAKAIFSLDNDGNINRCFNRFCFVPDSGIKSIISDNMYPGMYTIDKTVLQEKTDQMEKYSTYDVSINGNTITSKMDNDVPLLMTYKIGYAKGWDVYVDNQKVDTFSSYNGQLSFMLTSTGTHNIVLQYHTPGLRDGFYITIGSVAIFSGIAYGTFTYKKYKRGKACISQY